MYTCFKPARVLWISVLLLLVQQSFCQQDESPSYHHPPAPIPEILNAPPTPSVLPSPNAKYLLIEDRLAYPPVSDLRVPVLHLAGLRINPQNNGRFVTVRNTSLTLLEVSSGKQKKIALPQNALPGSPHWSPDSRHFEFTNTTQSGMELWVGDVASASAHAIPGIRVNTVFEPCVEWMPDSHTLLVETVPARRGGPPNAAAAGGPVVEESDGKPAPAITFENLLSNPHDEDLFEFYGASQLELVDIVGDHAAPVGKPAIFTHIDPSPDGKHILTVCIHRPFSYLLPYTRFPKQIEVRDVNGNPEFLLAESQLQDHIPLAGVATGPRSYQWMPGFPATLVWAEALDGGDTRAKVPFHDRLLSLQFPFKTQPVELLKIEHRFLGLVWGEHGAALVLEYQRDRRWIRHFLIDAAHPGEQPRLIWERSVNDRYHDPGAPLMHQLADGKMVMWQSGSCIFLAGTGATPHGDVPFLDRFDLKSRRTERLFQSQEGSYEEVIALVSGDGSQFLTRYESPIAPPNYFLRTPREDERRALTSFPDPAPQLHDVIRQLVTYKRADGVSLSFTLYLPADYKQRGPLPTLLWAYPWEYSDAETAGQVSGSPYRFTRISGASHLFLVTQGYVVLDNVTMPVIGSPDTVNNTFIEQIVADAKAAVEKAVVMGVTDPKRIAVGGHSYGAFMAANLLARCDLFRAGIAESGAYNRTLTPFGFQTERRTFWQAPEMYLKVSPFMYADKIKYPLLLIHGQADENPGTFPLQSERMYQAIKGNGGIARYVELPYEAHSYTARESVEETLFQMVDWFDRWVKSPAGSEPREASAAKSH
jgi:dipeptidyl aminopeptidase/acylaminoacyl peptidase